MLFFCEFINVSLEKTKKIWQKLLTKAYILLHFNIFSRNTTYSISLAIFINILVHIS